MRGRKHVLILAASIAVLALAGCASGAAPGPDRVGGGEGGLGTLCGHVLQGPVSPVETGGGSAAQPVPGLTLRLTREGRDVASPVTGASGEFRLDLSAGMYRLDLGANPQVGFSKDLPADIAIEPGRETRIEIRLDTGLR